MNFSKHSNLRLSKISPAYNPNSKEISNCHCFLFSLLSVLFVCFVCSYISLYVCWLVCLSCLFACCFWSWGNVKTPTTLLRGILLYNWQLPSRRYKLFSRWSGSVDSAFSMLHPHFFAENCPYETFAHYKLHLPFCKYLFSCQSGSIDTVFANVRHRFFAEIFHCFFAFVRLVCLFCLFLYFFVCLLACLSVLLVRVLFLKLRQC